MFGISGSLIWSKPLWNWYFIPVVNFWEVRRAQLVKSPLLTSTGSPRIFSDLLMSVQILKIERERERSAKSNGKLPHLLNPWWNCSLGSWDCGGRPAFGWTAVLVPCACSEGPALGQNTVMIMMIFDSAALHSFLSFPIFSPFIIHFILNLIYYSLLLIYLFLLFILVVQLFFIYFYSFVLPFFFLSLFHPCSFPFYFFFHSSSFIPFFLFFLLSPFSFILLSSSSFIIFPSL